MEDWIARIDTFAKNGEIPIWDNANYTCGAMRAMGLESADGWTLAFEAIVYAQREGCIQRADYAYGPGAKRVGYVDWTEIVGEEVFREDVDDDTTRSRVTGVMLHRDATGSVIPSLPSGGPSPQFALQALGRLLTLETDPTTLPGAPKSESLLRRLSPNEVVLFRLCDALPRNVLFSSASEVAERIGMAEAKLFFVYDDWQHVTNDLPSHSPDIVAMVEGLVAGIAPGTLGGRPNSNYGAHLADILAAHPNQEDLEWGPPIER